VAEWRGEKPFGEADLKKEMEQLLALIREGEPEEKQEEPEKQQPGVQQNVTGCNGNVTGGQNINL
jgi:hypothetical protein